MISLLKYLKDYKKESFLAPLFKMLEACFDLLVPLVIASLVDNGIGRNDTTYVIKMGGVLFALAAIGLTFSLVAQYFAAKAAAGFGQGLRHDLFKHIMSLSYSELDKNGTSTFITRMTSDVNMVQSQVNMVLRLLLRSPFIVFGAMIMAFFVDFKTALIFVIAIPVLSVIVYGIMIVSIPLFKRVQNKLDKVVSNTRENLTGVRVIRAFNKESEEVENFVSESILLNKFQVFAGNVSQVMNPLTFVVVNVAIIAILMVGGKRVNTGYLTQGEIIALVNYMSQILVELVKLANLIINVTKALACANRIKEVFNINEEVKKSENIIFKEDAPKVWFKDVSLTYNEGAEPSVSGIDFKAYKGQTIGVIGGTGSGKTSLVNMIPGFYEATEGQVLIDGIDVKDIDNTLLRSKIGIVPQKALLFKGTIKSNLLWGNKDATEEQIEKALKISRSYDFVMEKENGIDAAVEQNGKNFSGGQRQRLTIARALVRNPEILILDDSSSALDYATDKELRDGLKTIDATVFIVSQRTISIKDSDLIIVLDDGEVVGMGQHKELLENCQVYKEIYDSQFKSNELEGK